MTEATTPLVSEAALVTAADIDLAAWIARDEMPATDERVLRCMRHRLSATAPSPTPASVVVPDDVARLVVAARVIAFGDCDAAARAELDAASEAFADRVPWTDEPARPSPMPAPAPVPVTSEAAEMRAAVASMSEAFEHVYAKVCAYENGWPTSDIREQRKRFVSSRNAIAASPEAQPTAAREVEPSQREEGEEDEAPESLYDQMARFVRFVASCNLLPDSLPERSITRVWRHDAERLATALTTREPKPLDERAPEAEDDGAEVARHERAAICAFLFACAAEADRQRLNMEASGNKLTARACAAERRAYANAACMIEREDHASLRGAK